MGTRKAAVLRVCEDLSHVLSRRPNCSWRSAGWSGHHAGPGPQQEARDQVAFANQQAEQQNQFDQLQTTAARTLKLQREAMREEEIRRNTELAQVTRANQDCCNQYAAAARSRSCITKANRAGQACIASSWPDQGPGPHRCKRRLAAWLTSAGSKLPTTTTQIRNLAFVNLELQARKKIAQGEYANRCS